MRTLLLGVLLQACALSHVRAPVDAGASDCLRWVQRDNPEDVYCAEWRDGGAP